MEGGGEGEGEAAQDVWGAKLRARKGQAFEAIGSSMSHRCGRSVALVDRGSERICVQIDREGRERETGRRVGEVGGAARA